MSSLLATSFIIVLFLWNHGSLYSFSCRRNRKPTTLYSHDSHHQHNILVNQNLLTTPQVEAYTGPMFSRDYEELAGGIAIADLSLQILVGPSEVALGQMGLYIALDTESLDSVSKEITIPNGTPLCGYARGYFTDEYHGDKSVGFSFQGDAESFAVFYDKQLMSLDKAIQQFMMKHGLSFEDEVVHDLVYGHILSRRIPSGENDILKSADLFYIRPDPSFPSRIFVPEIVEESKYTAAQMGIYANDFAFDPESNLKEEYYGLSEINNILDLAWRMADGSIENDASLDKESSDGTRSRNRVMLIPTWPVVKLKSDVRIMNEVPMEIGLQYGFTFWDYYRHKLK